MIILNSILDSEDHKGRDSKNNWKKIPPKI